MYSNLKSVQYLLGCLKAYGVNKIVVSPGNSHNAIVRSLEEDPYFKTFNIVDERSAAFFACGLSQELNETIAICCTSGTAATNYLTGVTEAYRRGIPLVVITADKNQYFLAQYEDQMIDQVSIFKSVTKYDCILPIVKDTDDEWYCQRVLNETMLELNHHGKGPVHIDVPIGYGMFAIGDTFTTNTLPDFHKITRYNMLDNKFDWKRVFDFLSGKKVIIMCGQDDHISEREISLIEKISNKYNCVFAVDKLSNLHCKGTIDITRVVKACDTSKLNPDVIISIAGNPSMDYKFTLKSNQIKASHWIVNGEGRVADPFRKLTAVFEGNTLQFLELMAQFGEVNASRDYYDMWHNVYAAVHYPEFNWSNLYAVQKVMKHMPSNSNFNIANSTTIRIANYFDLDDSIQVYCNRGVNGIDGCVSAFIGQAAASPRRLNFLIVGDLTFFYDMNSVWNRYVGKNVRIMLCNNEGAALFHFNQGTDKYPTLNENVAAEHFTTAVGWVKTVGFEYISARNKDEFDAVLHKFLSSDSDKPIFFEVFTHKEKDADEQHRFYDYISYKYSSNGVKKIIKSILGEELTNKLKSLK